jgi:MoaA/NifB/PqqE/SkfB family radical SAM enzyme
VPTPPERPEGAPPVGRLDLKLGFSCNNRCRFCVQGDKRFRLPDRSTEEAIELLELGRAACDEVVLTGGEVTIRPDLERIVTAARELDYRIIQLQTNGRMLQALAFVERLAEAGVTEFSPALHGPTPEVHDALTRAPRSFKQTVRGIRNVKKLDLPVVLNSVVVQANHTLLPEMAQLFVALEVDQFQLAFVHALGEADKLFDEVVPRLSATEPYLRRALAIGRKAGVRCMTEGVPLCFLRGIESLAAEWIIPSTRILDDVRVVEDWNRARKADAKVRGPVCRTCRWVDVCEGPWREYPEHYGWHEFRPVA